MDYSLACAGQRKCGAAGEMDVGGPGRPLCVAGERTKGPGPVIGRKLSRDQNLVDCRGVRLGAGQCISIGIRKRLAQVFLRTQMRNCEERGVRRGGVREGRREARGEERVIDNQNLAYLYYLPNTRHYLMSRLCPSESHGTDFNHFLGIIYQSRQNSLTAPSRSCIL